MTTATGSSPIPKTIALIVVSLDVAWLMIHVDASALAKLNSMPAENYIQMQREYHQHSFRYHFILTFMMGCFYVGVVEFCAYVIRLVLPKKLTPPA